MITQFLLFLLNFIIPVFILSQGRKIAQQDTEHPLIGQIWKLTGCMLLPAAVIVSILSLLHSVKTQLFATICVLILQIIIFCFLKKSASKLSENP